MCIGLWSVLMHACSLVWSYPYVQAHFYWSLWFISGAFLGFSLLSTSFIEVGSLLKPKLLSLAGLASSHCCLPSPGLLHSFVISVDSGADLHSVVHAYVAVTLTTEPSSEFLALSLIYFKHYSAMANSSGFESWLCQWGTLSPCLHV